MRNKLIVLFIGVLLGFIPMYLENQRIKQTYQESRQELETRAEKAELQLAEAEDKLRIALLRDRLSSLILEARHDNFGTARVRSTQFFNRLREAVDSAETPATRQKLREVLDLRDGITATLASADPNVVSELLNLYRDFPQAVQSESVQPVERAAKPAESQKPKPEAQAQAATSPK